MIRLVNARRCAYRRANKKTDWSPTVIFQLTYTSRVNGTPAPDVCLQILAASRRNNSQLDVTGVLMSNSDTFLQTLEGSEPVVRILMDKISRDQRHQDVRIIKERTLATRQFGAWAMAYDQSRTNSALAERTQILLSDIGVAAPV